SRNEEFPEPARSTAAHGQAPPIPGIEVTDHTDAARIGRPHRKCDSFGTLVDDLMRAKLQIARQMVALGEQVNVEFAKNRRETIDVVELGLDGAAPYAQPVGERLPPVGKCRSKETVGMNPHSLACDLTGRRIDDRNFLRLRQHRSYTNSGWRLVHAEKGKR